MTDQHSASAEEPGAPLPPDPATGAAASPSGAAPRWGAGYHPPPPPPARGRPAARIAVGQPADVGVRFLARLIDYIALAIALSILVRVIVIGSVMNSSVAPMGLGAVAFVASAVSAVLSAAVHLGYFALMESGTGQTLGKMALGLRVHGPAGGKPTLEQAVRRNLFTAFGIVAVVPVVGGLVSWLAQAVAMILCGVTIGNSPVREGWHDRFAGNTAVTKVR